MTRAEAIEWLESHGFEPYRVYASMWHRGDVIMDLVPRNASGGPRWVAQHLRSKGRPGVGANPRVALARLHAEVLRIAAECEP